MVKNTKIVAKEQKKIQSSTFVLNCSKPVEDKVFSTSSFASYLREAIKIGGKRGQLGDRLKITEDGAKVTIAATGSFSKRYLKYLTKKYLKKHSLREFLYVIATDKKSYEIKYFNIQQEGADEE